MGRCRRFSESTALLQTSNQCYNGPTNVSMDSIRVAKPRVLNSIEHEWGHCSTGYEFGKIVVDELNIRQQHYSMIIENYTKWSLLVSSSQKILFIDYRTKRFAKIREMQKQCYNIIVALKRSATMLLLHSKVVLQWYCSTAFEFDEFVWRLH